MPIFRMCGAKGFIMIPSTALELAADAVKQQTKRMRRADKVGGCRMEPGRKRERLFYLKAVVFVRWGSSLRWAIPTLRAAAAIVARSCCGCCSCRGS